MFAKSVHRRPRKRNFKGKKSQPKFHFRTLVIRVSEQFVVGLERQAQVAGGTDASRVTFRPRRINCSICGHALVEVGSLGQSTLIATASPYNGPHIRTATSLTSAKHLLLLAPDCIADWDERGEDDTIKRGDSWRNMVILLILTLLHAS